MNEAKEAFEVRLINILERMRMEKEGWKKEKERLREEKENLAAKKEDLEEASKHAQRRIAKLEKVVEDKAVEKQKENEEAEGTRKIAEVEKDRE